MNNERETEDDVTITLTLPAAHVKELMYRSESYFDRSDKPSLEWTINKAINRLTYFLKDQLRQGRTSSTPRIRS